MEVTEKFNKIRVARGNMLKKAPIKGELFYDYPTKGVYIGTGTTTDDWKRIGGFDSLVLKGLLPSTVTTVAALNAYAKANAAETVSDENYNGLKAGDAYIITKDFTDKGWKSGDLVIWTGDIANQAADAVAMEAATNLMSDGWFYVNCGLVDASRVAFDTTGTDVQNTKTYKLVTDNDQLDMQNIQQVLELLLGSTLFYEGQIYDTKDISTVDGVMQLYLGPKVEEFEDSTGIKVKLVKNTLVLHQNGTYYYIPLGAAGAEALEGSFTDTERTADVDMTKAPVATKDADGLATTITKATDAVSVQQMLDWLHETKADLQSNGKIPLSQIPATLVGGLQYKGVITIGTDTEKASYTAEEFAAIIKAKFQTGVDDNNDDVADAIDAGDYVVISGKEATSGGSESDTDFEGDTITIDGVTYNSGDWAIYDGTSFSKMEGSAAVDNINGLKAAVEILGYSIGSDTGTAEVNDGPTATGIVNITVDTDTHSIRITTPKALQQKTDIAENKVIVKDKGQWTKETDLGVLDHSATDGVNTRITGKNKDGDDVVVEFPDESGKMSVSAGDGTEYFIPRYDADGNLIESNIRNNTADSVVTIGVDADGTLHDANLSYNYDTGLITHERKVGTSSNVGYHAFPAVHADAKGTLPTAEDPATLLDDASVIDCGEWL